MLTWVHPGRVASRDSSPAGASLLFGLLLLGVAGNLGQLAAADPDVNLPLGEWRRRRPHWNQDKPHSAAIWSRGPSCNNNNEQLLSRRALRRVGGAAAPWRVAPLAYAAVSLFIRRRCRVLAREVKWPTFKTKTSLLQ